MDKTPLDFSADEMIIEDGVNNCIREVTVFTDQAYVKRQARTRTHPGLNRLLIEIHGFAIDADSVQASVRGHGDILSVQYKEIPVKDAPQTEVRVLEEEKRELTRKRQALQGQRDVLGNQKAFLDSVAGFGQAEIPKEIKTQFPTVEQLGNLLQFLDENYRGLSEKSGALTIHDEELARSLNVLEQKLKQLRRPKRSMRKAIEVLFDTNQEHECAIEAAYITQPAAWTPVYKIDVPLDLSNVGLTLFARIEQHTGERWRDVKLSVSTAVPLRGARLPEPGSWRLDVERHDVMRSAAALAAGAPIAAGAAEPDIIETVLEAESAPEAAFAQAEQRELPNAFEYELPQPVDVDSGDGETLLPLYRKNLEGEFFVYLAPRLDPLAYLVCCAAADSALLAGRLNVFFGGRFVASTRLTEKKAGDELLFNFGAERGIRCQREKLIDKTAESLLGGMVDRLSTVRHLRYRILVENLKQESARIRLLDAFPVSRTDRIQVKDVKIRPEPAEKDYRQREGVMRWEFELAPEEAREITLEFFVKHPKNHRPLGL